MKKFNFLSFYKRFRAEVKVIQEHKSSCVIGYNLEILQSDLKNCGCLNIVECKHTTISILKFCWYQAGPVPIGKK